MSKYNVVTQKRNDADFDSKMAEYKSALENYQRNLANSTQIDPHKVIENLSINNDAGAVGTVEYLQTPSEKINAPQAAQIKDLGGATTSVGGYYDHDMKGDFLKVTFTNFNDKSTYVDMNGVSHHIGKVVVTYSDLTVLPTQRRNSLQRPVFVVSTKSVYRRPWNGVDVLNVLGANQRFDFYDDAGNYIDFVPGTAWMPFGSLTRSWSGQHQDRYEDDHVEKVKAISGAKLFQIPGGNATLHDDGSVYSDPGYRIEEKGAVNSLGNDGGAGIASIQNGATFRLYIQPFDNAETHGDQSGNDADWNFFINNTTALEGISLKVPTRKTTEVHYHYDVAQTTFQAEQYTILNAFLHIYYT